MCAGPPRGRRRALEGEWGVEGEGDIDAAQSRGEVVHRRLLTILARLAIDHDHRAGSLDSAWFGRRTGRAIGRRTTRSRRTPACPATAAGTRSCATPWTACRPVPRESRSARPSLCESPWRRAWSRPCVARGAPLDRPAPGREIRAGAFRPVSGTTVEGPRRPDLAHPRSSKRSHPGHRSGQPHGSSTSSESHGPWRPTKCRRANQDRSPSASAHCPAADARRGPRAPQRRSREVRSDGVASSRWAAAARRNLEWGPSTRTPIGARGSSRSAADPSIARRRPSAPSGPRRPTHRRARVRAARARSPCAHPGCGRSPSRAVRPRAPGSR
ncbi:hypothetical protein Pla163_16260 [Planctomycetes bacterium Pla163]|uniref:Uncharacterized protein n=1 Tax=Rohdeia mirabilis TaxID=2528008 RepID=A0A518CZ93_9BACT|nr:hypothetical protein Pla163_16260 [Planctomycetes bacterium Pla163]